MSGRDLPWLFAVVVLLVVMMLLGIPGTVHW